MSPEVILSDSAWQDMLKTPAYQEHMVALVIDEVYLCQKVVSNALVTSILCIGAENFVLTSLNCLSFDH